MALWKDSNTGTSPAPAAPAPTAAPAPQREPASVASLNPDAARRPAPVQAPSPAPHRNDMKESHIASDLMIEGKISGTGHVRIAGKFKGDVQVDGNVTLDVGAKLEGHVKAGVVVVSGELIGNIESAKRVELLESGVINGDVKAGSLTVAAGSRMRGQVEFGYEAEGRSTKP